MQAPVLRLRRHLIPVLWALAFGSGLSLLPGDGAATARGQEPDVLSAKIVELTVAQIDQDLWEVSGRVDQELEGVTIYFGGLLQDRETLTFFDGTFYQTFVFHPDLGDWISAETTNSAGETTAILYHYF